MQRRMGFSKDIPLRRLPPHVGQRVVLRMDLRTSFRRLDRECRRSFARLAYPDAVADLLGGICTNAAPRRMWKTLGKGWIRLAMAEARALYAFRHLPQGAPTSPALANLCAYRVDCRLTGLADAAGATFTRYADDLAFPWCGICAGRGTICFAGGGDSAGGGFAVHHRKRG